MKALAGLLARILGKDLRAEDRDALEALIKGNDELEALVVEREQQALLAVVSDAMLAVDLQGAPLFYNSRLALLVGETDLRDRKLWKMFLDREVLNAFQSALRMGESRAVKAVPFNLPSGLQYFSVSISPLRNGNGEIYGAVGIFHDVTDLKRAEQIRIDFVANVSHELRTPLTAIKGYTETLVEDLRAGRPAEREFVEVIAKNTDRLMSLINDLLDLSTIESTDVLQKADLVTQEVTARVLGQLQGVIESKMHRVAVKSTARTVHADPRRLEQVLVNLLDNAIKYTPEGGLITVSWVNAGAASSRDRGDVLLVVEDTGAGIPEEHQSRLFERFYRIDKARSRDIGGTGLGLAIVKHIMQRHDGEIWVESEPGHGAKFTCRFPGPSTAGTGSVS